MSSRCLGLVFMASRTEYATVVEVLVYVRQDLNTLRWVPEPDGQPPRHDTKSDRFWAFQEGSGLAPSRQRKVDWRSLKLVLASLHLVLLRMPSV
ncbi:hypothetical protein LY76DRAFT_642236 [Colletotrichum caudatum]|nr:hypothetical protein LY76DRAFT_642236 [Colletotrichum caudatum]